jgi:hypothetical protein
MTINTIPRKEKRFISANEAYKIARKKAGGCYFCSHPLSDHFDASYSCNEAIEPAMADGLTNFCHHCEEDATWQQ